MRRKFCQFGIATFAAIVAIGLWTASAFAVLQISSTWRFVDYWLAWFTCVSFVGAVIMSILTFVAFAEFLDGICNRAPQ